MIEDLKEVALWLKKISEQDSKGLNKAIEDALCTEAFLELKEFTNGLEDELNQSDKFWLLGGLVQRKVKSLNDIEVCLDFLEKVIEVYMTKKKRKRRCLKAT